MDQAAGNQGSSSTTITKVERRVVEKNRRNQMKILYSKLYSLLPNYDSKEALPLPEQVDEAINYIKMLEAKVKMGREKKERLVGIIGNKRSRSTTTTTTSTTSAAAKSPRIEIHETGSSLQLALRCGLDSQFIFYEIIRLLHEENVEVLTANSSMLGDSFLHVLHAEIPQSSLQMGATKVSERLKRFVEGSSSSDHVEIEAPQLWDFEIGTDLWTF